MRQQQKTYEFDRADRDKAEKILQRKWPSFQDEMQPQSEDETVGQQIRRLNDSLEELLLLEVVNKCVPYSYSRVNEEPTDKANLEEKQAYLARLLSKDLDGPVWQKALRFMKQDIKGPRLIQQLKTTDGKVLRKFEDIAEYLNCKYTIRTHDSSKLIKQKVERPSKVLVFKMTVEQIANKLEKLGLQKSAGASVINNEMLNLAPSALAPYLHKIYTLCLQYGILPDEWLHSQVVPAYKGKGKRTDEDSYRPISVSPPMGKVLEHIVADYLYDMLDEQTVLHIRQHGHRKGFSNESQLACFSEDLSELTRHGGQVDCLKIDLKSATSYVSHKILLDKLKCLAVDEVIYRYIKYFIKKHCQSVKVGSAVSSRLPMKQGLSQGSPITNPLFLIYIDGIFDCFKNKSRLRGFGDDLLVYRTIRCKDDQYALQEDLYLIQQYIEEHGLQANLKKLEVITFFNPKLFKKENYLKRQFLMFGIEVPRTQNMEYLGVTFSSDMTFHKHVQGLLEKFEPEFDAYMQLTQLCSASAKNLLYVAVLRPKLEMCSSIWNLRTNFSEDALIAGLERLQQKFAAFVLNSSNFKSESWDPSWDTNLKALDWEPLMVRRMMKQLQLNKNFMKRVPCLWELAKMQSKLLEEEEKYSEMRKDSTSLLARCKKEWRRMRAFFKKNAFRDLSVEESCEHCADLYCSYVAKMYAQKRTDWVQKLEKLEEPKVQNLPSDKAVTRARKPTTAQLLFKTLD